MIKELSKMIDHSILHPTYGRKELIQGCKIAQKYDVASVCVKPYMVRDAITYLKDSDVKVGCVIGFPAGNATIETKIFEAKEACTDGAEEIDMVINIAKVLEGEWEYVTKEIKAITETCHHFGSIIKVIFETDYIHRESDIVQLCNICTKAEVDYVKTSTGYGFVKGENGKYSYTGATIPHLTLMKKTVGPKVKVKASGGVRTFDQLMEVKEAGATRCGATATAAILEEAKTRLKA